MNFKLRNILYFKLKRRLKFVCVHYRESGDDFYIGTLCYDILLIKQHVLVNLMLVYIRQLLLVLRLFESEYLMKMFPNGLLINNVLLKEMLTLVTFDRGEVTKVNISFSNTFPIVNNESTFTTI